MTKRFRRRRGTLRLVLLFLHTHTFQQRAPQNFEKDKKMAQIDLFPDLKIKRTKASKEYGVFTDKFKTKLTTDDCYTPGHRDWPSWR